VGLQAERQAWSQSAGERGEEEEVERKNILAHAATGRDVLAED